MRKRIDERVEMERREARKRGKVEDVAAEAGGGLKMK